MKHEMLVWLNDHKRDDLLPVTFDTDQVFEIHSPRESALYEDVSPYIRIYNHGVISSSLRVYLSGDDYKEIVEAKNLTLEKGEKLLALRGRLLKENKRHKDTDIEIKCTVMDERIAVFETVETLYGDYYSHSVDIYAWNEYNREFKDIYDINGYDMTWVGSDFIRTEFRRTKKGE